ncbi:MAG TPA: alpha/beta fold hydrolase [Candidatus Eremiobacteraeota bacterium]|nr:alpha/beta fold hydrolase [Candidatus Eremiobacteraeota bacterium]
MSRIKRFLFLTGALGLMASINSYIFANTPKMKCFPETDEKYYDWKEGDVFYKVKGEGKKILLLHGIYFGASSFEWRKNFLPLAEKFKVYSIDLIGFGKSAKIRRGYRSNLYVKLIFEFIDEIIRDECYIVATSLTCNYAIRTAILYQKLVKGLFLIGPLLTYKRTGNFELMELLYYQLLGTPVIGTSIYNIMTSKAFIRNFLEGQIYSNSDLVTRELVNHYYMLSHQKGSEYFFPSLMTGLLELNVKEDLRNLPQSIFVLLGKKLDVPPSRIVKEMKNLNPKIKFNIFENSKLFPHDEQSEEFNKFIIQSTGEKK